MEPALFGSEAYGPKEIAARVEDVGVAKAALPTLTTFTLAVLGGAYIGLGAMGFTLVTSDATLGFAASRVLGGLVFSMGLFLVVAAGAELFTGNNLLVMAFASRRVNFKALCRNWGIVLAGNALGAAGLAVLVAFSGHPAMNAGGVGEQAIRIAAAKLALPWREAFLKGVLCNILVCLAVWMALGGRSLGDKLVAVVFPVTVFVAAGFEHSVANLYFIPLGILLPDGPVVAGFAEFARHFLPVILGNVVGGGVLVGLVYWVVYRRRPDGS